MNSAALPLPPFYHPEHAARWDYRPRAEELFQTAADWRTEYRIPLSAADADRVHLLLIDEQKDFCLPEGALYVGGRSGQGAVDDTVRVVEFVYRNLPRITRITATLDSHLAYQIFFASFWVDAAGHPLTAHRLITAEEVRRGVVKPNPAVASWLGEGNPQWLREEVIHYTESLERAGKYQLYLWPPHCLLGGDGHALVGLAQEARLFHAYVRGEQTWTEEKGQDPLTENYSALGPEVPPRHHPRQPTTKNTQLIARLLESHALIVAGQAASHCVRSTVEDLLAEVTVRHSQVASKIYLLVDCMSAVAVPDGRGGFATDFTAQAEATLQQFQDRGAHLVRSTDPMSEWPGFKQPPDS